MLVLSRKQGESLVIDGNTVIRVLEVRKNQIRLGIEAPVDVPVLRTELCKPPENMPVTQPATRSAAIRRKHDQERAEFDRLRRRPR